MPKITLILSSLMGLMCVWLAFQVIKNRRKHKISLGDGGIEELARAIRAHGNFIEYVPISLILLGASELNHANSLWSRALLLLFSWAEPFMHMLF